MVDRYTEELQNIIRFSDAPKQPRLSAAALFKDYFATLHNWRKKFNIELDYTIRTFEGHNIFRWAEPNLIESFIPYEKFKEDIKGYYKPLRKSYTHALIYYYIHWEIFKDHPVIKKYDGVLPSPYESAIIAIKRGAELIFSEMYFNVSGEYDILYKDEKYFSYRLPSKEESFLNYIDERCGSHNKNIPTQKDLDLLFEEFNTGQRNLYHKHYDN